ncbi:MAG: cell division protein ZapE [Galactobacter sp.]|uniref:cell division protein ZapE n=1 Tax=Galactobacter sp. TaxID=2676125 RepID=UPI0025C09607|nr:cell division protein ZapE [Galactobacter sp.]
MTEFDAALTNESIAERVRHALRDSGEISLDSAQEHLLGQLGSWLDRALEEEPPAGIPVGCFVHGSAGRGKTWLLGQVFAAAPVPEANKRRVHFHQFFLALQERLGAKVSAHTAIEATVQDLLSGTRLFFFDELHVQDPGAAALLNRLLAEIAERHIPTLITSNYAPEGLLPHRVYHHVVQPGIETLRRCFEVRELLGATDYRRLGGGAGTRFASGAWVVSRGSMPDGGTSIPPATAASAMAGIAPVAASEATTVLKDHHALPALAVRSRQVVFDALTFLESPVTSKDMLDLASLFDDWVLLDVEPLSRLSRPARQRLVTMVDVLVDADIRLTVTSQVQRAAMSDVADPPTDWFRAASRLDMLGTGRA